MQLHRRQEQLCESIARALDLRAIREACQAYRSSPAEGAGGGFDSFRPRLAAALRQHLRAQSVQPGFQDWLDVYFGVRRTEFRHPLQRPSFLYYPSLDPVPWFDPAGEREWDAMREHVEAVAEELRRFAADREGFRPYVEEEALNDALWRPLAGRAAWSSIYLLRKRERAAILDDLPRTSALLQAAPLAECEPHAPECFISRLQPGTVLPPHHGLSNIKLTVHLPVHVPPEGCTLTVAGRTETWRPGNLLVFDDSFLHSAANRSGEDRTVLIFDIWHPALQPDERKAFAYAVSVLDIVMQATAS